MFQEYRGHFPSVCLGSERKRQKNKNKKKTHYIVKKTSIPLFKIKL